MGSNSSALWSSEMGRCAVRRRSAGRAPGGFRGSGSLVRSGLEVWSLGTVSVGLSDHTSRGTAGRPTGPGVAGRATGPGVRVDGTAWGDPEAPST